MPHHTDHLAYYEQLAADWSRRARETEGRQDPASRLLRARATTLTARLAELRKRLAAARDLGMSIEALVIEANADDAVEETAAGKARAA